MASTSARRCGTSDGPEQPSRPVQSVRSAGLASDYRPPGPDLYRATGLSQGPAGPAPRAGPVTAVYDVLSGQSPGREWSAMTDWRWQSPHGYDGYRTKPDLWRPLAQAIDGFDVDPAGSTAGADIADRVITEDTDALTVDWAGAVFLNPPFSNKDAWHRYLRTQYADGPCTSAVAVAPCDPSTQWFQTQFSQCDYLALLEGRDWFIDPDGGSGSPSFSTMVGVWGDERLVEPLTQLGTVYAHE